MQSGGHHDHAAGCRVGVSRMNGACLHLLCRDRVHQVCACVAAVRVDQRATDVAVVADFLQVVRLRLVQGVAMNNSKAKKDTRDCSCEKEGRQQRQKMWRWRRSGKAKG